MTPYEIVAICLSSIAILIPIIQWAWKKWVCKAKLNYYPIGQAYLYFDFPKVLLHSFGKTLFAFF